VEVMDELLLIDNTIANLLNQWFDIANVGLQILK
jgi:hypothetical protein